MSWLVALTSHIPSLRHFRCGMSLMTSLSAIKAIRVLSKYHVKILCMPIQIGRLAQERVGRWYFPLSGGSAVLLRLCYRLSLAAHTNTGVLRTSRDPMNSMARSSARTSGFLLPRQRRVDCERRRCQLAQLLDGVFLQQCG